MESASPDSGNRHLIWGQVEITSGSSTTDSSLVRELASIVPGKEPSEERVAKAAAETEEPLDVALPSKGSALHEESKCRPCFHFLSKSGCQFDQNCMFCHLHTKQEKRERPGKAKRALAKKRASALVQRYDVEDPDQKVQLAQVLSGKSEYLKTVVQSKLQTEGRSHTNASPTVEGWSNPSSSIVSL